MLLAQSDGKLAKAARLHVAKLLPQQPRGGGRAWPTQGKRGRQVGAWQGKLDTC